MHADEMQGRDAWGTMFLNADTGLVSHTDLYRLSPHIGLGPKSIADIQKHLTPKPKKKTKRKRRVVAEENNDAPVFTSKNEAVIAYVNAYFPEYFDCADVDGILSANNGDIEQSLCQLMTLGEEKKTLVQKQNRKRKRNGVNVNQTNNRRKKTKKPPKYVIM